jgi:hypothetical protein
MNLIDKIISQSRSKGRLKPGNEHMIPQTGYIMEQTSREKGRKRGNIKKAAV